MGANKKCGMGGKNAGNTKMGNGGGNVGEKNAGEWGFDLVKKSNGLTIWVEKWLIFTKMQEKSYNLKFYVDKCGIYYV